MEIEDGQSWFSADNRLNLSAVGTLARLPIQKL